LDIVNFLFQNHRIDYFMLTFGVIGQCFVDGGNPVNPIAALPG